MRIAIIDYHQNAIEHYIKREWYIPHPGQEEPSSYIVFSRGGMTHFVDEDAV